MLRGEEGYVQSGEPPMLKKPWVFGGDATLWRLIGSQLKKRGKEG
jgi:hypothetical protein